jgi:cytochrome c peroxidase
MSIHRAMSYLPLVLTLTLAGCNGGGGGGDTSGSGNASNNDAQRVRTYAKSTLGLTGDPATPRGATQLVPDNNPLVKLGQLLFFSQTLSANYDVSCGTCHHPDFGGGDGLSLSVGVYPIDASTVGPGREVEAAHDLDPSADGGPNMPRNSLTTYNTALYDRTLMYDGRVFVLDDTIVAGGIGQPIRTPESFLGVDEDPVSGLMEFTVKLPIITDNEMRGYTYTEISSPGGYREHLMQRLRGEVDTEYNTFPDGPGNWLRRFRAAFGDPLASADEVITTTNVQRALAAYINSQVFVNTPWRFFLQGDDSAVSNAAIAGAELFLKPISDGGLGCAGCHSGDRFTDEAFHNVGFPQIGRGQRADHTDPGRWNVLRFDENLYAFRTPGLLNIAETAPYGHAGTFATLEDVIRYHANPRSAIDFFDFTLASLIQFQPSYVHYVYAEPNTRTVIGASSFDIAEPWLPGRSLSTTAISQLVAFLETLTDRCVANPGCIGRWAPGLDDDPDGNTLFRDVSLSDPTAVDTSNTDDYPESFVLNFPPIAPNTTFADVQNCENRLVGHNNTGADVFTLRDNTSIGLTTGHSYSQNTWFNNGETMVAGGISAGYINEDCWPDLVYTGTTLSGLQVYSNSGGVFFEPDPVLNGLTETEFTGTGFVDLNGDYRRELIIGNLKSGSVFVMGDNGVSGYDPIGALSMVRPTFGMSFAPLDNTGFPYLYFGHWTLVTGTNGTSPSLWKNDGTTLRPWDKIAGTSSASVDQRLNFTPKFADFTGDGNTDLVIASDFGTSVTLRNVPDALSGEPHFVNETDRTVITDENGMGGALLDIDNDGNLEWFVTSVFDFYQTNNGGWGDSGNRLYTNVSTGDRIAFKDITREGGVEAGVRDGNWGWGACAADFNNDGFIDLFHVNGFGYIPDGVSEELQTLYHNILQQFIETPPRLFMNAHDGSFVEQAAAWGIDVPSEGRGLACFDYDRDGDIDITLLDQSTGVQFFENRSGSGTGRAFLDVRVIGEAPNTDAIGARVYVTADLGGDSGTQTQLRLAEANSNFNSQNLPNLHFGLADAATIDEVKVIWPDGTELSCANVAINQFIVLDQRDGQAACP